ncbi:hypothetical protein BDY19DRAFT_896219 [Irpex rosettiformis]|uniref:Uncharacterized protein n=1 Tax=Irpex rosettiformis TaxID=378272 RepID=A0ACB8TUL1_9APHY|nr:hypothetical protein BDY19DRAFT_896219 [Irpex rosettiformis]
MDFGANFTSKLEPFLLMSKSAKGAAAAKLVQDATSAPGVFVFAELLELPNIQELTSSEQHAPYFSLLQLFAYKTYTDYLRYKDSLPALNQAQITKLKHLTLVSLAMEKRILPYSQLSEILQISSIRELEDLIIDAIYLEVIRGKLDQREQQFKVEYTMGRDIEPGKVESILVALQHWASTTSSVLSTLDQKLGQLANQVAADNAAKESYDKQYQLNVSEMQNKQKEAAVKPLAPRPPPNPNVKSGPTAAGLALLAARNAKEAEKNKQAAKDAENTMDVDDENKAKR